MGTYLSKNLSFRNRKIKHKLPKEKNAHNALCALCGRALCSEVHLAVWKFNKRYKLWDFHSVRVAAVDSGSDLLHCYRVSVLILPARVRPATQRQCLVGSFSGAPTKVIHSLAQRRRPIASHRID